MKTLKYALKNEWYNLILLALPFAAIPFLIHHLPHKVALRWSLNGHAEQPYGDKWLGLMLIPLCNVFLYFGDLSQGLFSNKRSTFLRTSLVLFLLSTQAMLVTLNIGVDVAPINLLLPLTAAFLFVTGNYFRTHQPVDSIGIHIPWSFADPDKWHQSHRFAVFLWMSAAFLLMITLFSNGTRTKIDLFIATIIIVALLPTLYSFYLYNIKY